MLPNRIGFRMPLTILLSLFALFLALVAPVAAEEAQYYQGEPTDPEKMLVTVTQNADDLQLAGADLAAPEDQDAFDAWYQAMIDLLEALGLLPPEDSTP